MNISDETELNHRPKDVYNAGYLQSSALPTELSSVTCNSVACHLAAISVCHASPKIPRNGQKSLPSTDTHYFYRHEVGWPSGLRRWFKAPVSSEAWVRIPPQPVSFSVTQLYNVYFIFRHTALMFISFYHFHLPPCPSRLECTP